MPNRSGSLFVLAGCNGAGKSSIGGAALLEAGVPFFNPDEAAKRIGESRSGEMTARLKREANGIAWEHSLRLLRRAIAERGNFAFETTLGGNTIPDVIGDAAAAGVAVRVWFVGLDTVVRNIERVRRRVAQGGHDIPEVIIRERSVRAPVNLIRLLPGLAELELHDNSVEGDPVLGHVPRPRLLLHFQRGRIVVPGTLEALLAETPRWAKAIVTAALRLHLRAHRGDDQDSR